MCVFDGGISLGALSQRGSEDKRNLTTDPTDISFTRLPFLPILFYLSLRGWHKFCAGTWFPFPLPTSAHCGLYFDFAPFPVFLASLVCLLRVTLFTVSILLLSATLLPSTFLCHPAVYFPVSVVFSPSPPNCHFLLNWPIWVFSNVTQQDSTCSQCVLKYIRAKMVRVNVFWSAIDIE